MGEHRRRAEAASRHASGARGRGAGPDAVRAGRAGGRERARAAYSPTEPIPAQAAVSDATTSAVRSLFAWSSSTRTSSRRATSSTCRTRSSGSRARSPTGASSTTTRSSSTTRGSRRSRPAARPDLPLAATRVLHRDSRGDGPARHGAPARVTDTRPASPEPVERQLWLARHGKPMVTERPAHGPHDIPLTETGRNQAVTLGERLRGHTSRWSSRARGRGPPTPRGSPASATSWSSTGPARVGLRGLRGAEDRRIRGSTGLDDLARAVARGRVDRPGRGAGRPHPPARRDS